MEDNILIQEIEKYLAFLKKMSKDDLSAVLKKEKEIIFEIRDKSEKVKSKELLVSEDQITFFIEKLGAMDKREDAILLINELNLSRIDIERFLKKLDIHFTKKDPIPRLKEKLLEGTIGFKLRSEAIQKNP